VTDVTTPYRGVPLSQSRYLDASSVRAMAKRFQAIESIGRGGTCKAGRYGPKDRRGRSLPASAIEDMGKVRSKSLALSTVYMYSIAIALAKSLRGIDLLAAKQCCPRGTQDAANSMAPPRARRLTYLTR